MLLQVIKIFCFLSCLQLLNAQQLDSFVRAEPQGLSLGGQPYHFVGMNLWQAVPWAMGDSSSRKRLLHELDQLAALKIKNLRILATAQGPADAPWRITQNLQVRPDSLNSQWLKGLDLVLHELAKRDMKAVLYLGNFWHWSGGFAQYVAWAENSEIPYPPPGEASWRDFEAYASRFYRNRKARNYYQQALQVILLRKNSLNGRYYIEDPCIMAWELANEPRAGCAPNAFCRWLRQSARQLQKLAPHQLVCTGSEGLHSKWQALGAGRRWRRQHRSKHIDYLTVHLWPQNWGWYQPEKGDTAFLDTVRQYLNVHLQIAKQLHKPLVLEEVGLARDDGQFEAAAAVHNRKLFFEEILAWVQQEPLFAGVNFWAWAGEQLPVRAGKYWRTGETYSGDPPHEPQGWYGIYFTEFKNLKFSQ